MEKTLMKKFWELWPEIGPPIVAILCVVLFVSSFVFLNGTAEIPDKKYIDLKSFPKEIVQPYLSDGKITMNEYITILEEYRKVQKLETIKKLLN